MQTAHSNVRVLTAEQISDINNNNTCMDQRNIAIPITLVEKKTLHDSMSTSVTTNGSIASLKDDLPAGELPLSLPMENDCQSNDDPSAGKEAESVLTTTIIEDPAPSLTTEQEDPVSIQKNEMTPTTEKMTDDIQQHSEKEAEVTLTITVEEDPASSLTTEKEDLVSLQKNEITPIKERMTDSDDIQQHTEEEVEIALTTTVIEDPASSDTTEQEDLVPMQKDLNPTTEKGTDSDDIQRHSSSNHAGQQEPDVVFQTEGNDEEKHDNSGESPLDFATENFDMIPTPSDSIVKDEITPIIESPTELQSSTESSDKSNKNLSEQANNTITEETKEVQQVCNEQNPSTELEPEIPESKSLDLSPVAVETQPQDEVVQVSAQQSSELMENTLSAKEQQLDIVCENLNATDSSLKVTPPRSESKTTTAAIPSFRKVPSAQIVKGCIHNILTVMRADQKCSNPNRLNEEGFNGEIHIHPVYVQFQGLLQTIGANPDQVSLLGPTPSDTHMDSDDDDDDDDDEDEHSEDEESENHEENDNSDSASDHDDGNKSKDHESEEEDNDDDDEDEDDDEEEEEEEEEDDESTEKHRTRSFLYPFCDAVKRRDVGAMVTGAVLTALYKFILFDLFTPDQELGSNLTQEKAIRMIADSLIVCTFEEATEVASATESAPGVIKRAPPSRGASASFASTNTNAGRDTQSSTGLLIRNSLSVSYGDAEHSVLKLLEVIVATVDYSIQHGRLLPASVVTKLLATCFHVSHRAATASPLLRSAASAAARQIVTAVFRDVIHTENADSRIPLDEKNSYWLSTFRKLNEELEFSISNGLTSSVTVNVLTMLNMALESIQGQVLHLEEKEFLKNDLYKSILSTAIETRNCLVLESSIRAVYSLWVCMRFELKGEFEVFLQSVHFRILDDTSKEEPPVDQPSGGRWRRAAAPAASALYISEGREVVLENLIDICRLEPNILQEIYFNYDCDVACSNLFEAIITALGKIARPLNWMKPDNSGENQHPAPVPRTNSTDTVSSKGSVALGVASMESCPAVETTAIPSELASAASGSAHAATNAADNQINRKQPPLNHMNCLALDGILSVLYSFASPSADEEVGASKCIAQDEDMEDRIIEINKTGEIVSLSEDLLHSRKRKKHSLQAVIRAFSDSSDDWLSLAVSEGIMPESFPLTSFQAAKVAAEILYNSHDVDKTKLGSYLSRGPEKRYPFEFMVRKEFAALHDFTGMTFPIALRSFLSKFRMPGEAQCIDRIMEVFSREFYEQQGESTFFKNSDAVYVLAFSTIMLNTDLHNKTIKAGARMTRDQFVRNNRGINAGEDLDEAFLSDLYNQIKDREIQVRREVRELVKTTEQENFSNAWDGLQLKKAEMACPVFVRKVNSSSSNARIHDKEMFLIFANASVQALTGVFVRAKDDATVIKALRSLKHIVSIASFFELDSIINDIVHILLTQGREYITNCIGLDYNYADDGASVGSNRAKTPAATDSMEEDENGIDTEKPIPYELLCSNEKQGRGNIAGSASHKGLLSLDTGFILFRKHASRITTAWPTFIECLCALRDARALPEGLSELDDFADSNGNVLPLSSFAINSKKALDDYYRSLANQDANKNKSWFRSFFRGTSRGPEQDKSIEGNSFASNNGELSVYAKALLSVAEAAEVEDAVQMGSMKLPDATIQALLATVAEYPFVNDPVAEQQAVFSMELAARALLSDRSNATSMFPHFLITFESVLCKISSDSILSPFVIERIVVAILRCSIHLYEIHELRPSLRSSLQLITTTLPKTFIRVIADRMACGMAIILRASFQFFETTNEWTFMGDTLDMLANYSSSREFVFDGIASTVEYAIPSAKGTEIIEHNNPQLSLEACESLSRILIRFTLGFYKGDLSLTVPAMLCLEKLYRFKLEILLSTEKKNDLSADPIVYAPDKEFWQNFAVAVYAVCRSADPETSRHGMDCFRRIILRTRIDQIPDEKWIAILYLMVNKQPPLSAELSRGNTFSLLGHLLARVLPTISHKPELKDDLEDLFNQVAALTNENLSQCRRGNASPLFEKTLQTATYLSNHMASDEWGGDKKFSSWASEALLKELERAGANILQVPSEKIIIGSDSATEKEHIDESEVSELSVTDCNGDDE